MIYHARAWTFFCIFFCFLGEGFRWFESMLLVCGTILPFFLQKLVSRDVKPFSGLLCCTNATQFKHTSKRDVYCRAYENFCMSSSEHEKSHRIVTLVLRFLFVGLLFHLFAFNLITKSPREGKIQYEGKQSRTSQGTDTKKCFSEPSYDWDVSHIHLVFIGDSLTRYQFLSTSYQLHFKTPPPKYIVNEKVHKSWLNFYQNTSVIFNGSMKCDCFRYENDVYKQSVKQSFSFSRENRFFSFSLRCENSATLKVLFTYIQFFGDENSLHGRVLPWNIKHASPTKTMRKSLWRYYELREALESFVAKLKTKPIRPDMELSFQILGEPKYELEFCKLSSQCIFGNVCYGQRKLTQQFLQKRGNVPINYIKIVC